MVEFQNKAIFKELQPKPQCPKCGSSKHFCDGTRTLPDSTKKQRYLCRECYYRYTYPSTLKSTKNNSYINRISAKEAKNLEPQTENKTVAGESLQNNSNNSDSDNSIKSKIIDFSWWMKKEGYKEDTIRGKTLLIKIMCDRGANLYDPESIKAVIAQQTGWSEGRKENAVNAYSTFLRMTDGTWKPPIYTRVQKIPFIPTEKEIDDLIAACSDKCAALLQTLKETGCRIGEAWMLEWTDIDTEKNTLRITPEKGSNPRIFKISPRLLLMLNAQPKKSAKIFGTYPLRGYGTSFTRQRRAAAMKLGNPRLIQISFHTFRHWKATMEYHKTKDIIRVMRMLGHKNIKNTMVYTQLVEFDEDDQYVCKVAVTTKEATELVTAGFEYVCTMDDGARLFRKRA
jgi:integrase